MSENPEQFKEDAIRIIEVSTSTDVDPNLHGGMLFVMVAALFIHAIS
jgi:hypothetical protein